MPVYVVAGLTFLFYLMALPVRAGAAWRTGQQLRIGMTVGPFRFSAQGGMKYVVGSGLIASLTQDGSGKTRELSLLRNMADTAALSTSIASVSRALKYLYRHVRLHRMKAYVHFSFSDAAATAFLYGITDSALSVLRAVSPSLPLNARVSADFRTGRTQANLCGILSCRFGHIMAAALIWGRDYLARRLHTWISSRSKAS